MGVQSDQWLLNVRKAMLERERLYPNDEDISAASLLMNRGYENAREEIVADKFITRVAQTLTQGLESKPSDTRDNASSYAQAIMRQKVIAMHSAITTALFSSRAIRTRNSGVDLISALQAEGAPSESLEALKEISADGKISLYDALDYEVKRKYSSSYWRDRVGSFVMSEAGLMRELAGLLAVRAKLLELRSKNREQRIAIKAASGISKQQESHQKTTIRYAK